MATRTREVETSITVGGFAAKPVDRQKIDPTSGGLRRFIREAISSCDYAMTVEVPGEMIGDFQMPATPVTVFFSETVKDGRVTSLACQAMSSICDITNLRILPSNLGGKPRYSIGGNFVQSDDDMNVPVKVWRDEQAFNGRVLAGKDVWCGQIKEGELANQIWEKYCAVEYYELDHEKIGVKRETPEERTARFDEMKKRREEREAAAQKMIDAASGNDEPAAQAPAESDGLQGAVDIS